MAGIGQRERQNAIRDQMNLLSGVEDQILLAMQCASTSLTELSKDKIGMKPAESNANNFVKELEDIENKLTKQISLLTQYAGGSANENSPYGSKKDCNLSLHRMRHAETAIDQLLELQRLREESDVNIKSEVKTSPKN